MYIQLEENGRLNIELSHSNGEYRVYVRKEIVEIHESSDGRKYQSIMSVPYADGNFFVRICQGRKSSKKLENGEKYLEDKKDKLKDFWLREEYVQMGWVLQDMFENK